MRKIFFALVLMWPAVAFGQTAPDTYAIATPAQIQGFNSSTATGITAAIVNRAIRVVCTAACNIWINASGQVFNPTVATGVYLPANLPTVFSVTPGSKVKVIGNSGSGQLYVMELTR
jgi:hypothetical protein